MPIKTYMPQLDGLRFFAAFLVILSHFRPIQGTHESGPMIEVIGRIIGRIQQFGWIGVDIFLVLSSFLISKLLSEENSRLGGIDIGSFYIRRALRIWPLYFPYLIISMFVLTPMILPAEIVKLTIPQHFFPYALFMGNFSYNLFAPSLSPLFAHLWTVSLEEQFYLIIPILACFSAYLKRFAVPLSAFAFVLTFSARFYVLSNGVIYPTVWVFPLCRLDPFLIGAICAGVLRRNSTLLASRHVGSALLALSSIGFALVLTFPGIGGSLHTVWQLHVVALSSGCLLLATFADGPLRRIFSLQPLVYFGKISFGIYVYHQVAIWLNNVYIEPHLLLLAGLGWTLSLASVLAIVIVISTTSYVLWERSFLRLKIRFENVQSRPSARNREC